MKDEENLDGFFFKNQYLKDFQCTVIGFLGENFTPKTPEPIITQQKLNAKFKKAFYEAATIINKEPIDAYFFIQDKILFVIVKGMKKKLIYPLLEQCVINFSKIPYIITITCGETIYNIHDLKYGINSTLNYAEYARFLEYKHKIIANIVVKRLQKEIIKLYPNFEMENYERALLDAIFHGNIKQAEEVTNHFLISIIMRNVDIFISVKDKIYYFFRFALALCVKNPWKTHIKDKRLEKTWNRIFECKTLKDMQGVIRDFFCLLGMILMPIHELNTDKRLLQQITDHIKANYSNPLISQVQICEIFNISVSFLTHIFKRHVGMSFSAYIQILRIDEAKQLIISTNESMNTIAKKVGYSNGNSMLKLFKRIEGLSPTQYKKNIMKAKQLQEDQTTI